MHTFLNKVLDYLNKNNSAQYQLLSKKLEQQSEKYFYDVEVMLTKLNALLMSSGQTFEFGLNCYNKKLKDIFEEYLWLLRNGTYRYSSFEEVNNRVYSNPDIMEYHTIGLLFLEIVNPENYAKLNFFREILNEHRNEIKDYFEIGGGHGLYTWEASKILNENTPINFLDISETSLEIASHFLNNLKINFIKSDILLYKTNDKFDFIVLGSVLEHVEKPLDLLIKIRDLLSQGGKFCLTVPVNDPAIDHIYLFKNIDEIKQLLHMSGFKILRELIVSQQQLPFDVCYKYKLSIYYTAVLESN